MNMNLAKYCQPNHHKLVEIKNEVEKRKAEALANVPSKDKPA